MDEKILDSQWSITCSHWRLFQAILSYTKYHYIIADSYLDYKTKH